MLKWIALGGVCLLVLVVVVGIILLRRTTVYVTHPFGFTAFGTGNEPTHHTDEAGLTKVMARLLKRDIYDMMWVSGVNDTYSGVTLSNIGGELTFTTDFKTASQQKELAAFKKAMDHFGYKLTEDSNGFNGGMTEDCRETTLDYELPADPIKIVAFTKAALAAKGDAGSGGFYLTASLFANGPGAGSGVKIQVNQDPLSQVL